MGHSFGNRAMMLVDIAGTGNGLRLQGDYRTRPPGLLYRPFSAASPSLAIWQPAGFQIHYGPNDLEVARADATRRAALLAKVEMDFTPTGAALAVGEEH
jgi:hypothetical protein